MNWRPPEYLSVAADQLGQNCPVKVRIVGDLQNLAEVMASDILAEIRSAQESGGSATLILPVGPVDQFPILARHINEARVDCRDIVLINMDEYLGDDGQCVPPDHPLSF